MIIVLILLHYAYYKVLHNAPRATRGLGIGQQNALD